MVSMGEKSTSDRPASVESASSANLAREICCLFTGSLGTSSSWCWSW